MFFDKIPGSHTQGRGRVDAHFSGRSLNFGIYAFLNREGNGSPRVKFV